jgi:hypothetical protein
MGIRDFGFILVVAVALAVGITAATTLGADDALRNEIAARLKPIDREPRGLDLLVDGAPGDAVEGVQIAVLFLVLGGFITTIAGASLATWHRRRDIYPSERWAQALYAAFVFQSCALAAAISVCALVAIALSEFGDYSFVASMIALVLILNLACNVFGVASWRTLQLAGSRMSPLVPLSFA